MSIKNQRTLLISSTAIIVLTAASMVGLNFLINRIGNMPTPTIAFAAPEPRPSRMIGVDDAVNPKNSAPPPMLDTRPSPLEPQMKGRPPMIDRGQDDSARRIRNGKDAPEMKRADPASRNNSGAPAMPKAMPQGMPPGGYYPPPFPPDMDPKERERIEQEMQRYQDSYYGGPPPGYFPPQMPPGYENSYPDQDMNEDGYDNMPEEFYEEYDYENYYNGYDSKLHDPKQDQRKSVDYDDEQPRQDPHIDEDLEAVGDFFNEFYED